LVGLIPVALATTPPDAGGIWPVFLASGVLSVLARAHLAHLHIPLFALMLLTFADFVPLEFRPRPVFRLGPA
jgi:hypothetical protein